MPRVPCGYGVYDCYGQSAAAGDSVSRRHPVSGAKCARIQMQDRVGPGKGPGDGRYSNWDACL
jgi:hypothetical protein